MEFPRMYSDEQLYGRDRAHWDVSHWVDHVERGVTSQERKSRLEEAPKCLQTDVHADLVYRYRQRHES